MGYQYNGRRGDGKESDALNPARVNTSCSLISLLSRLRQERKEHTQITVAMMFPLTRSVGKSDAPNSEVTSYAHVATHAWSRSFQR